VDDRDSAAGGAAGAVAGLVSVCGLGTRLILRRRGGLRSFSGGGAVAAAARANPKPIFIDHYALDPVLPPPPTVHAVLTFNGVSGAAVYYDTSKLNPGDILQIALQADATGLATGVYSWQIVVAADYPTPTTTTRSGTAAIVNANAGDFGPGWTVSGLSRLTSLAGGALLDLGEGHTLWFALVGGSYVTPAGDFSTLTTSGGPSRGR